MEERKWKTKVKCPVCGKYDVHPFETCEVCGWSNDTAQHRWPDMRNGDNTMSFNEAKKAYKEGREIY